MAKREWIAEFEVVAGPLRVGDQHPTQKGWFYTGRWRNGVPLWYRPPRFNRWQLIALSPLALFAAWVLCMGVGWAWRHWLG